MNNHLQSGSAGVPNRRASILRRSYFLDRLLVALASVLASIGIAFGAIHAIGLRAGIQGMVNAIVLHRVPTTASEIAQIERQLMQRAYPFDPFAPIYEQFAQFTVNVLTWPPVTVALLACGALAATAHRYAY